VNEVGPVSDEQRVDVRDVHGGTGRLLVVVELREQLEYRRPHHFRERVDIGLDGGPQNRTRGSHPSPLA
jgi:hypothetical protein